MSSKANTTDQSVWENFYNQHVQSIRDFAAQHSSQITYVEVPLDSQETGQLLEKQIGISKECWKHCLSSFTQQECKDLQDKKELKAGSNNNMQSPSTTLKQRRYLQETTVDAWILKEEQPWSAWTLPEAWDTFFIS